MLMVCQINDAVIDVKFKHHVSITSPVLITS